MAVSNCLLGNFLFLTAERPIDLHWDLFLWRVRLVEFERLNCACPRLARERFAANELLGGKTEMFPFVFVLNDASLPESWSGFVAFVWICRKSAVGWQTAAFTKGCLLQTDALTDWVILRLRAAWTPLLEHKPPQMAVKQTIHMSKLETIFLVLRKLASGWPQLVRGNKARLGLKSHEQRRKNYWKFIGLPGLCLSMQNSIRRQHAKLAGPFRKSYRENNK